ncbi:hypothetical protein EVAR_48074_1 [Eumeta japonica]|uniref:Uncharacterized protein n=1 Tax=Eumeta variegata TaxID=151549 RepID=A0A4C1X5Q3_EUMVA|nr:hypothetical protein EVAR_48074_1 [Eumeta japonica]
MYSDFSTPCKPALWIFFTFASEYGFSRRVGKMMDSVSMFRLVYCSTSFTSGDRSTTATDTRIPLQFIDGASACTCKSSAISCPGVISRGITVLAGQLGGLHLCFEERQLDSRRLNISVRNSSTAVSSAASLFTIASVVTVAG